MAKFNVPVPEIEVLPSPKYKLGHKKKAISDLKHHTLAFSFEYACFHNSPISLNYNSKQGTDYIDFLKFISFLSEISVQYLIDNSEDFHFHEIDLNMKYYLKSMIEKLFKVSPIDHSTLPEIYQIAYHNEESAPRICGFFGSLGVFYILWWDFNHLIYFSPAYHRTTGYTENWYADHI